MDILGSQKVSIAAKLDFKELLHLYELGDTDKTADLILSLLLSAHSVAADWRSDCLDYLEANNIIDAERRAELEHNKMAETVESVINGVKTVGGEVMPHIPAAFTRAKEYISGFAERAGIDLTFGGAFSTEKPKEESDKED